MKESLGASGSNEGQNLSLPTPELKMSDSH
jgi:hypothetical protein